MAGALHTPLVTQDLPGRHRSLTLLADTPHVAKTTGEVGRQPGRAQAPQRLGRVLVVEDEPDVAELLRFEVRMSGKPVELTPKEFELLAALVATPGRVFGREELLDLVWGHDGFVEPRTVDVHVARLRGKFTVAKLPTAAIETVRGIGYRFRDPG